jgi:hypothetical protein
VESEGRLTPAPHQHELLCGEAGGYGWRLIVVWYRSTHFSLGEGRLKHVFERLLAAPPHMVGWL